jgi:hypothetical protein
MTDIHTIFLTTYWKHRLIRTEIKNNSVTLLIHLSGYANVYVRCYLFFSISINVTFLHFTWIYTIKFQSLSSIVNQQTVAYSRLIGNMFSLLNRVKQLSLHPLWPQGEHMNHHFIRFFFEIVFIWLLIMTIEENFLYFDFKNVGNRQILFSRYK